MRRDKTARRIVEHNPNLTRFLNTCNACGCQGHKPEIVAKDFAHNLSKLSEQSVLTHGFQPLTLDDRGLCPECDPLVRGGRA